MKKIVPISLLLFICISCLPTKYGSKFYPLTEITYEPTSPCRPEVVLKVEKGKLDQYTFLGTCTSKKTSSIKYQRIENAAMIELLKCACKNGGNLVKIISHEERADAHPHLGLIGLWSSTHVFNDHIIAEIYVKKK